MDALALVVTNLALALALFAGLWAVAQITRDPSFVDAFWAFGIVVLALSSFVLSSGWEPRSTLITGLVLVWGLRLGAHLGWRWLSEGEDARYKALVSNVKAKRGWPFWRTTAVFVFLPQAVLLWVTALPAQLGQASSHEGFGLLALIGAGLAVFGIVFESLADFQLARFKHTRTNEQAIMDKGLWAWSRHPNYFGEAVTWWGIWLIAAETTPGLWAVFGPLFLTFTLTRWSGAPMLEKSLRARRPAYYAYVERTSAFIPWPPGKARGKPQGKPAGKPD